MTLWPGVSAAMAKAESDAAERERNGMPDFDRARAVRSSPQAAYRGLLEGRVWLADDEGACDDLSTVDHEQHWLWVGAFERGRPVVRIAGDGKHYASRLCFASYRASVAADLVVERQCTERECVNPWHHEQVPNGSWLRGPDYALSTLTRHGGREWAERIVAARVSAGQ